MVAVEAYRMQFTNDVFAVDVMTRCCTSKARSVSMMTDLTPSPFPPATFACMITIWFAAAVIPVLPIVRNGVVPPSL